MFMNFSSSNVAICFFGKEVDGVDGVDWEYSATPEIVDEAFNLGPEVVDF